MDEVNLGLENGGPVGNSADSVPDEDPGLASPFLNKIPAADRAVVGRYIKDWDAGVTKKFQEYSGKLKPYETLGSVEELQKYVNLANNIRNNPEMAFRLMFQGFQTQYGDEFEAQLPRILGLEEGMSEEYYPNGEQENGYQPEADPNEVFQQNVMTELEELRQWREDFQAQQLQAEENEQLNAVLQALHRQYGEFDDDGVLVQIAKHGDPHKAVQEWKAMIGRYSQNGAQRQAPKVMGGQGGVPQDKVNVNALRGADRKAAVMNALAALDE